MSDFKDKTFFEATSDIWAAREIYRAINPDDEKRVWELYKADYEAADDGGATVWGRFTENPTKGDIVADYHSYIPHQFIATYVKQFARADMVSMLNLLIRGMGEYHNYMSIKFADKVEASLGELVCVWNEQHPDEPKILLPAPEAAF